MRRAAWIGATIVSVNWLVASDALLAKSPDRASDPAPIVTDTAIPFWASGSRWAVGAQVAYALENAIPRNISHVSLIVAQPEVSFTLANFGRSPVRQFEIVNQPILGGGVHPRAWLIGDAVLFRLKGRHRGPIVPFFDAGSGMQYTTLNRHAPELNGSLQFSPQGGPGFEYFVSPQRAVVFQYRYLHMSNADIHLPNRGLNASMVSVGFRWFEGPRALTPKRRRNPFTAFAKQK